MTINHEIIINNVKSRETVCYSLLIIKGHFKNADETSCQSEQICVTSTSQTMCFKTISNKFKGIVELQPGENVVTVTYCCCERTITVNYVPRNTGFSVLPLYIICHGHDGRFQAPDTVQNDVTSACKRITLCAKLLQSVMAEKFHAEGQTRKTFKLEDDCAIFRSRLNYVHAKKMTQQELWEHLGREIISSGFRHATTKFLGFLSCTKYCGEKYEESFTHEDVIKITEAYVALGGGGFALMGTACLYTWPEEVSQIMEKFEDCGTIDRRKFMDDSCYKATIGACFSTTLGAVLHELCHTFDLGHTETGVMGRGFDDIYKVFLSVDEPPRKSLALKTFSLQNGRQDGDGTFWTQSCLILLAYHKWLNDFDGFKSKDIKFDEVTRLVSCTTGLRVVELRQEQDGMVLLSWTFAGKILKYSFHIPEDDLKELQSVPTVLVVEDNFGNILKQPVSVHH